MVNVESKKKISLGGGKRAYRYKIYRPFTDEVEELPDIPVLDIQPTYYPKQGGKHMTELQLWPLFVCYRLYYHEGRPLDVEDIHAMMRLAFHGNKLQLETKTFEKLDGDAGGGMLMKLFAKANDPHFRQPWIERIGRWDKELHEQDPDVKAKAEELSGL